MTARTSAQALADVASALVEEHEITGLLARLVADCAELVPAEAAAILVRTPDGRFELLSATSHRVEELELYQGQSDAGPCVDAATTGEAVDASGQEIVARWGSVGAGIVAAGFRSVHAFPMRWRGHAIGGLGVFSVGEAGFSEASAVLAQSFADFATLAIVQPTALRDEDLADRITAALEGRSVVEQAKGVLAVQLGLDMAEAYDELLARSSADGSALAHVAQNVVRAAYER